LEWWLILVVFFSGLLALFAAGVPVAFAFMLMNFLGIYIWSGNVDNLLVPIFSSLSTLSLYSMLPAPLFTLMGAVLFESGIGTKAIDSVDNFIGNIPGRISIVTIIAGGIFGALSGSAIAMTALFGKTMYPEMKKRQYSKEMSLGSILGGASLALIIPPSVFVIILASVAQISVGKLLIAGVFPGIIAAIFFIIYIVIRVSYKPSLAPTYQAKNINFRQKIAGLRYLAPLAFIVFLVTGLILLGVATPTESSALGALGAIILAAGYKKLNLRILKNSFLSSVQITAMIMLIAAGSITFSQLLAITGGSRGLAEFVTNLPLSALAIVLGMQLVIIILGMFIDQISEIMICIPIFMPIVAAFGLDPIWFGATTIVALTIGTITPPFGTLLFTLKGTIPECTAMDIYKSSVPYFSIQILVVILIIFFPAITLWLPGIAM